MLQSFRFANHRSFRDEQQLNLVPAFPGDHDASGRPVPVAGVFGANASGKTNVLDALEFMRYRVLYSDREVEPGQGLERKPFRLVRAVAEEPSRYVADIWLDGERHTYGFTIDESGVLEEWLYRYLRTARYHTEGRLAIVFERTGEQFTWGPDHRDRRDLQDIAEFTAPTALFLSTTARLRLRPSKAGRYDSGDQQDPLHRVYRWFRSISTRRTAGIPSSRRLDMLEDDEFRSRVAELMRVADFGIVDLEFEPRDPVAWRTFRELMESGQTEQAAAMRSSAMSRVRFRHSGADSDVLLDLADESRGTRQLLELAMEAIPLLARGGLLLIDEIDVSLHPMLSATATKLFRSSGANPQGAQLIFTSHDTSLMGHHEGEEVLKRDEIWFTEKQPDGSSQLYSLAEFKPRKSGENRERRYLNGSYGAVPRISADSFVEVMMLRKRDDVSPEQ